MRLRSRLSVVLAATVALFVVGAITTAVRADAAETGPFQVINYNSGKCMDVEGRGTFDANVHQWTCHQQTHQLWRAISVSSGYFKLVPEHTYSTSRPGCLTIPDFNVSNGADARMQSCFIFANEEWSTSVAPPQGQVPTPNPQLRYRFINRNSGKCLEVSGGSGSQGGQIQQWTCNGTLHQLWVLAP